MSRPAVQSVHGFRADLGIHCDSKMEANLLAHIEAQDAKITRYKTALAEIKGIMAEGHGSYRQDALIREVLGRYLKGESNENPLP
jgi:hypothetical protein